MVLPTDHHWALRGWLRLHGIEANELAGDLIVGDLDELLRLSGAPRRLSVSEHALVSMARSRDDDAEPYSDDDAVLAAHVEGMLAEVSQALCEVGVQASPWQGAGVMIGDQVFDALVCVDDTVRLYELMRAEGFAAEPDWDAPPLRERTWPEA